MSKEYYRYDLHVHTSESSKCAKSSGVEMVDMYKAMGFDGIVITDHFYCGNTCVPRDLPWDEWLMRFKQGYEHAAARGREVGLDVFYAWEYSFFGTDYIALGLDNDWLLQHPEVRETDIVDYLNLVHDAGGYVIHAHPFREAGYIPYIRLLPRYVDAVEVHNANRVGFENDRALDYARAYDLAETGGSDCHSITQTHFAGIEVPHRFESMADIVETLRRREQRVITVDKE